MRKITAEIAFELVGRMIGEWSLAECHVDDVVGEALKLTYPQSMIICKTLSIWQKMEMLKKLINSSLMNNDEKTSFIEQVAELKKLSEQRNTIAHCIFLPNEDRTGVKFFDTKKREISAVLSECQFSHLFERFEKIGKELENLEGRLKQTNAYQALSEATPFGSALVDLGNAS